MGFKGLSNAVTNTHPLLPSMGTTRQKSSCRNRLQNGPHSLLRMKVGTHSPLPTGSHTTAHTPKQVAFWVGVVSLPSERSTRFGNPAWPGFKTANFAALGSWSGVLPKNAESLGTAMRLCASLSRGVAAPLGCVIFSVSVEIYGFTPRTQGFLCVRGGGGITTPGVRCVLPKFSAPACQSSLFAVF